MAGDLRFPVSEMGPWRLWMDILRGSGLSWVTDQGEGRSGDKGAQAWDRTPLRGGGGRAAVEGHGGCRDR